MEQNREYIDFSDSFDISNEKVRQYIFRNSGIKIEFESPALLIIQEDNSHIIKGKDGRIHYIDSDWVAITIEFKD